MRDDCRVIGHALLEYVYGDLDEIQRKRVDRHLSACPRCATDLRDYRDTLALIDESTLEPSEDLSEHFSSVVLAILRRRAANRRLPAVRALAAACLAFFLAVGAGEFSGSGSPKRAVFPTPVSLPSQIAEIGDPLVSQLALRNLTLSTGARMIWYKESSS